jgi:molybdopterin-guanine dinucleotide biosynthesis protein A
MKLSSTVGLVLCGGQSARMGRDKGLITYHKQPQREHTYHLLSEICDEVYLSCNQNQNAVIDKRFNIIVDDPQYFGIGPLGAILTSFEQLPGKDILVVGCDYPFLTKEELNSFLESIGDSSIAASFFNETYEPALAWYSHRVVKQLLEMFRSGEFSLNQFLTRVNAHKYFPRNPRIVKSIDTPVQSEQVYQTLNLNVERIWK